MRLFASFLLTLILCASPIVHAANKLIQLTDEDPIPKEVFIFAIYDLKTQKIHLAYSKDTPSFDDEGLIVGGIRTGGHAALAMKVANAESYEEFDRISPDGSGRFIGGGFVVGNDGYVHIHRLMSIKAAGATGNSHIVNTRLAEMNSTRWRALMPEAYFERFFGEVVLRVGKPLVIDNDITNSTRFPYNFKKHSNVVDLYVDAYEGTSYFENVVSRINQDLLDFKNSDIINFDDYFNGVGEANVQKLKANPSQAIAVISTEYGLNFVSLLFSTYHKRMVGHYSIEFRRELVEVIARHRPELLFVLQNSIRNPYIVEAIGHSYNLSRDYKDRLLKDFVSRFIHDFTYKESYEFLVNCMYQCRFPRALMKKIDHLAGDTSSYGSIVGEVLDEYWEKHSSALADEAIEEFIDLIGFLPLGIQPKLKTKIGLTVSQAKISIKKHLLKCAEVLGF